MDVGSQTDPMDPEDVLNLVRERSSEKERRKRVAAEQEEIHSAPEWAEEVHSNSQSNEEEKKRKKSKRPTSQHSLADKICEVVWSRKESFHSAGPSRTPSASRPKKNLVRSQSFSKGALNLIFMAFH